MSSVSTYDQFYLHCLQADLNSFSSEACLVGDCWHKLFMETQQKPWLLWQPQGSKDLQLEKLVITIIPSVLIRCY